MTRDDDVVFPMCDGVALLADVFRPTTPGRYPVLIAASPYLRQIMVGDIELQLEAVSTAAVTAWIASLQDIDAAGTVTDVTAGYLRAALREVNEAVSRPGAPAVPCRTLKAVPIGEPTH